MSAFRAIESLHRWPRSLHRFIHWFLPSTRRVRASFQDARSVLVPFLKRRYEQQTALTDEQKMFPSQEFCLIDYIEETANKGEGYDQTVSQIGFQMAAIHTTSDLLSKVIWKLCEHPDLIQPLRDEVISVIGDGGWQKTSLLKLKLMDSVVKETHRLAPHSNLSMQRIVTEDMQLQDGLDIPKGTYVAVTTNHMWKSEPKFDGYRYLNMRSQAGKEHKAHLVAYSLDHMGFGIGRHACPGRFFAANEVKIALCHILLKYDWKLIKGNAEDLQRSAIEIHLNPRVSVAVRRRREEILL
ncbi:hypothetical protein N7507_009057 [Penicillium longicatenatum]|nr:hypothetical protein N7507_009057 [Penicillium longicatenatum]